MPVRQNLNKTSVIQCSLDDTGSAFLYGHTSHFICCARFPYVSRVPFVSRPPAFGEISGAQKVDLYSGKYGTYNMLCVVCHQGYIPPPPPPPECAMPDSALHRVLVERNRIF